MWCLHALPVGQPCTVPAHGLHLQHSDTTLWYHCVRDALPSPGMSLECPSHPHASEKRGPDNPTSCLGNNSAIWAKLYSRIWFYQSFCPNTRALLRNCRHDEVLPVWCWQESLGLSPPPPPPPAGCQGGSGNSISRTTDFSSNSGITPPRC